MIYGETKMGKYLVNGFSPNMISKDVDASFTQIDEQEFCINVPTATNAIGHDGTVSLINMLCGTHITTNRVAIKVQPHDSVYIFGIATRLPEGKVLTRDELVQLLESGKIQFWKVDIFPPILATLAECGGRCDEAEYDHLAFLAKGES